MAENPSSPLEPLMVGLLTRRLVRSGPDRVVAEVDDAHLDEAIRFVRELDDARFITLSAVDLGIIVELNYHFSVPGSVVTIRTSVPKSPGKARSITHAVPAAELIEHEVMELFGITFEGNPRTKNLILPDGWSSKPPLRGLDTGPVPEGVVKLVESVVAYGCSVQVSSRVKKVRDGLGLKTEEGGTCAPEMLDMAKKTGIDQARGYRLEKDAEGECNK